MDSHPNICQYPLINHLHFSSNFFVKLHDDKFAGMLITVLWKCSSCATPANPIHAKTWLGLFRICLTVRKVSVAKQNVKRRCFDSTKAHFFGTLVFFCYNERHLHFFRQVSFLGWTRVIIKIWIHLCYPINVTDFH